MTQAKQKGFTLLEAIIALMLISTSGMALFSWINTTLITLERIKDNNAIAEAKLNVLQYMNTVNPMLAPQGAVTLGNYSISWQAEPTTPIRDNVQYPKGQGLYQIALYETTIGVNHLPGTFWFDFKLKQVGYKRVREIKLPI